jgi:hypothetical protein
MTAGVRRLPFRQLWHQLLSWREARRSVDVQVVCPVDSWPFRARYTDGRCPLCGWEAPGAVVSLPLSRRIDSFSWMALSLIAVSAVMLVLVVVLYTR